MSSNAQGHDRVLGSLGAVDGRGVVRMEDRFDTDIDDLWSALTTSDRLARWLGDFDGDLRLGGTFRARYFASGWEGTGRIDECEPTRRLLVQTKGSEAKDEHAIEVTLSVDGDETVLAIEIRGMPLDQLAAYGAGIQVHIEDLAAVLGGRQPCEAEARWGELFPRYQDLPVGAS